VSVLYFGTWPHIRVEGVGSAFRYFRDGAKLRG
jgi:hypothetical protein